MKPVTSTYTWFNTCTTGHHDNTSHPGTQGKSPKLTNFLHCFMRNEHSEIYCTSVSIASINDSCDPEPQTAEIEDQTPRSSGDQARDQPDEMAKFWIKIRQPFRKTVFFFRDNITARSRLIKSTAKFRLVYILNDVFYYIIDLMKTSPWRWWLTSWWRTTLLPGLRYCACPTITPHSYRYPVIPAKFPVAAR